MFNTSTTFHRKIPVRKRTSAYTLEPHLDSEKERKLKHLRQSIKEIQIEVYNTERKHFALLFKNWYLTRLISNLETHEYCKVSKIHYGVVGKLKKGEMKNWLMIRPYWYLKLFGVIKHYLPTLTIQDALTMDLEPLIEQRAKQLYPKQNIRVCRKFS